MLPLSQALDGLYIKDEPELFYADDDCKWAVEQCNGQLICGPPVDWSKSIPGRGTEIFIGKLPRDVSIHELIDLCTKLSPGALFLVRLMMDFSGNNRGYAFAKYATTLEAKRACGLLNMLEIRENKFLGVRMSVDNNRLFIGGIPKNITKEELKKEMSEYFSGITKVDLLLVPNKACNRGYCFLEFASHQEAAAARRGFFSGQVTPFPSANCLSVDWAEPEIQVADDVMDHSVGGLGVLSGGKIRYGSGGARHLRERGGSSNAVTSSTPTIAAAAMTSGPDQVSSADQTQPGETGAGGSGGTPPILSQAIQELLSRTGYPLIQENGQRKYGPPKNWSGTVPAKGCEVFVGKIPRDVFEDELIPVMERAGKIYEVRLMMDLPGTNRGYAFVQYTSRGDADTAVTTLNNYEIRPRRYLGVMRSVDNNRLFVGGIPKTRSQEEVLEEMRRLTEGVTKIILYPSVADRTKNRGYAFVEFDSHKSAAMARRRLFTGRVLLWGAHEVKVDWAEPELNVDTDTMSKVKVLYIRNLALSTTEDDILNLVNAVSAGIERVKKQKDYAFVHFQTREQAELAKQHIDGKLVHGCELEVTWAKPVKNREEYQQRKALARCMVSSTQTSQAFLQQLAPTGILNVPVRRAAGAQGIAHTPKMKRPYPAEVLNDICTNEKWGEPQYETFELRGEKGTTYTTKVIIPYFPNGPAHFQSDKMSLTAEGSKDDASNYVLRQLGVLQTPGRHINATQSVPATVTTPLVSPMQGRVLASPQALRGPPLTPQYYMAPPLGPMAPLMAPPMAAAAAAAAAASAQGMHFTGMGAGVQGMNMNAMAGQYLMPTGYESINPLAFQAAAYYMAQPGAFPARYPGSAE